MGNDLAISSHARISSYPIFIFRLHCIITCTLLIDWLVHFSHNFTKFLNIFETSKNLLQIQLDFQVV